MVVLWIILFDGIHKQESERLTKKSMEFLANLELKEQNMIVKQED
jgi:hypothetical protein